MEIEAGGDHADGLWWVATHLFRPMLVTGPQGPGIRSGLMEKNRRSYSNRAPQRQMVLRSVPSTQGELVIMLRAIHPDPNDHQSHKTGGFLSVGVTAAGVQVFRRLLRLEKAHKLDDDKPQS